MKTIPQCREELEVIAKEVAVVFPALADRIRAIVEDMVRRPCVRRAAHRQRITEEKRAEIRAYAAQFPDMSYHELSRALDVNTARISETLNGKRGEAP